MEINNVPTDLQTNLINLQRDSTFKIAFKEKIDLVDSYESLTSETYKELKRIAQHIIIMLDSTYICEQTFSILNYRKKHCSRLSDIHLDAILRVLQQNCKLMKKRMQVKCNNKNFMIVLTTINIVEIYTKGFILYLKHLYFCNTDLVLIKLLMNRKTNMKT